MGEPLKQPLIAFSPAVLPDGVPVALGVDPLGGVPVVLSP